MSEDTIASGVEESTITGGQDTVISGQSEAPKFDWRKELSGDDEQFTKKLERYATPDDFRKAVREQDKRISEGFKAPELPENANEDQLKEYRAKLGVPEKLEDYKFPDGIVVGEEDKPIWDLFLAEANKSHMTQAEFNKVAPAYYALEKHIREQSEKNFKDAVESNTAALKEAWKADFDANLNINKSFLEKTGGKEFAEQLLLGSAGDGTPLANHPSLNKWLNEMARLDGFRDPMPGGAGTSDQITGELDKYRKMMREDRQAWNKDIKAQERYRELVSYQDKISKA